MSKKYILEYMEYDIVGHCNLNCKGCSHFSNIQNQKEFITLEPYQNDLRRMKELFSRVARIKIIGGEPLLHPQINEIIDSTREILPRAIIDIVTNGLLINKMDQKFWSTMKECNARLLVTMYKPTDKIRTQLIDILESNEINYQLYEEKQEFHRQLTLEKRKRKWASHEICDIKKCTGIQNGMLGKCPMAIHMNRFNKRFNTSFPENEFINIYDSKTTAKDILKFIKNPIELCNYCSMKHELFEWEVASYNKSKKEDWFCKYNEGTLKDNVIYFFVNNFNFIRKKFRLGFRFIKRKMRMIFNKCKKKFIKILTKIEIR